jgi:DNA polymerase-4
MIIHPSKVDRKSIGLGRTFDPEVNRTEIKRRISILCRHLSFLAHKISITLDILFKD